VSEQESQEVVETSEPTEVEAAEEAVAEADEAEQPDHGIVIAEEQSVETTGEPDPQVVPAVKKGAEIVLLKVAGAQPHIVSDDLTDDLKILLGEFEGPLDLLLHLIRQEQVSIYDIPVARITDEYLRYLRVMQELDIAVAGDFLVMAATLIELKTKMLLPRDPLADPAEEEDPRLDLVNQLLEYQKYKAAAEMLWSKATVEQAVFKRAELETDKNNPEVAVGVFDLLKVFQTILARHKEEVMMEIEREEISMAEMLERLRNMVMSSSELNLRVFFERARSRRELVLAFLSVLELVRATEIKLFQRQTFGDIIARVG
jgi:segregation and condensation protein A